MITRLGKGSTRGFYIERISLLERYTPVFTPHAVAAPVPVLFPIPNQTGYQ